MPHPNPDPALKAATSRNVLNVVLGETPFKTWYPSFYPDDLVGPDIDPLYVCRWCFKYSKDVAPYLLHAVRSSLGCLFDANWTLQQHCELKTEFPGAAIYSKAPYAVYEVDGEEHKVFAQNLSLFAKLFLDNKSVFFDVYGFKYYLLVRDASFECPHPYPVGFFSKEKMSWDNNNLACILVFPPWQRQGLGKILMGVSYEISKREGHIGGPEKPLSELGRKSYLRFWQSRVAREALNTRNKSSLEVQELAARCYMLVDDVVTALKEMGVCELRKKDNGLSVSKNRVREWARQSRLDLMPPVDEGSFLASASISDGG